MNEAEVNPELPEAEPTPAPPRRIAYRHRLPTRLWHWVNALTVFVMLMSGLMIFNAHPHLYWGNFGANFDQPWLSFRGRPIPGWTTIPSTYNLAAARRWHLAFAWLLVVGLILFLVMSFINRHAQLGSFDMRAAREKSAGAPIEIISPAEGIGWDMEAFAIVKGTKKADAARKVADWAVTKAASELYSKFYAVVAHPEVKNVPKNYPADAEARMAKVDFQKMADDRARVLAEWSKRYESKAAPKN